MARGDESEEENQGAGDLAADVGDLASGLSELALGSLKGAAGLGQEL